MSALTTSWDDATVHDRKLVSILNEHGIKGTWNVNSGRLGQDKTQTGWEDIISPEEMADLYAGHEVACHSVTHPVLASSPEDAILSELVLDRMNLEALVGYPVLGLAFPFGSTGETVRTIAKSCGFVYGRAAFDSGNFSLPDDLFDWHPSYHFDAHYQEKWADFLDPMWDGKLFFLWGHSFEFENNDSWDQIEAFCQLAGGHPDLWYATNLEVCEYLTAWRDLHFSVDRSTVKNNSCHAVWIRHGDEIKRLDPEAILSLE